CASSPATPSHPRQDDLSLWRPGERRRLSSQASSVPLQAWSKRSLGCGVWLDFSPFQQEDLSRRGLQQLWLMLSHICEELFEDPPALLVGLLLDGHPLTAEADDELLRTGQLGQCIGRDRS